MNDRTYDLVLFGATGFTGRLTAKYLAGRTGETFRWAIAGRSRDKLERLRSELGADAGVVVADSADEAGLAAMARSARVVATTVGPYDLHGEPLVRACAQAGTDYADLTGEPAFIDRIVDRYDAAARESGARIVNCCGFESVPVDLGTLLVVRRLGEACGGSLAGARVEVESFVLTSASPSGGTWQSAVGILADHRAAQRRRRERARRDAAAGRTIAIGGRGLRYRRELGAWSLPFPVIDQDVVLHSARAMPAYGATFEYGHHALLPWALAALAVGTGGAALFALAQFGPTRRLLLRLRGSGEGPDEAKRARSWFETTVVGRSGDRSVGVRMKGGDPGYDESSKILAECGLCLALDRDRLPPFTGVVTPAMGMGEVLVERLSRAGLAFEPV